MKRVTFVTYLIDMVNTVEFAARLKTIMDYYGLSAAAFADSISVNRSSISHLLSGRNKPSLDFVVKVVDTYDEVELYWLLNGKGSFPKSEGQELKAAPTEEKSKRSDTSQTSPSPQVTTSDSEIEQIIIFYKDGSFRKFRPD